MNDYWVRVLPYAFGGKCLSIMWLWANTFSPVLRASIGRIRAACQARIVCSHPPTLADCALKCLQRMPLLDVTSSAFL
ncbi:hypothetical protein AOQ84DRAFT_351591 [Glonium stellatum]|uniref:Uncharacterized protein n=1 Tax=Glonium stellatum TaxID=574774 RepID=A0A8E2FC49_9PEZI|nr:hypothetical protein AOQ84DRAFT_351591 [Glonium stellatum]